MNLKSVEKARTLEIKDIKSRSNPTFKGFLKLLKARGIRERQMTFISGRKHLLEILRDFPLQCAGILLSSTMDIPSGIPPQSDLVVYYLGPDLFRELDIYGTSQPILLVKVPDMPLWEDKAWPLGCTLFVPFQDPANVGAILRSAAAFGVSRVIMLKEAAHPFHHKSARAAGSALFRLPLFKGPSIEEMGRTQAPLIMLSPEGRDIRGFRFPKVFGLLPGIEGPGLPENLRKRTTLAIPMEPGVESLNAVLAASIALYLWYRR